MNFDEAFFRRIIAKSNLTEAIPTLNQLVSEASVKFYEEFDYYPNLGVCAPGTFTITGEYVELAGGLILQAALPLVTVILVKSHSCLKCRIVTSCKEADEPNRIVIPATRCRPFKKGYPKWANLLKGLINNFMRKSSKGFDVLIHSSVPVGCGFGSSAALETAFYSLLQLIADKNANIKTFSNARKCQIADEKFGESRSGSRSNYASFLADAKNAILLDTREESCEFLSFHDPNVLFLLAMPTTDLLHHPKNLIRYRETELKLAAKLVDLDDIKYVEESHLQVLASMDDPSKEKVRAILWQFERDEKYIFHFLKEFFTLPRVKEESEPEVDEESHISTVSSSEEPTRSSEEENDFERGSYTKFEYKTVCNEPKRMAVDVSVSSEVTVMSKLMRRVNYVLGENHRTQSFIKYLTHLDFVAAGMELTRSHLSMKSEFEVSSPELDELVQFTAELGNGVFGSKMMKNGGTLTLVHRNSADAAIESIKHKFGDIFHFYLVFPSPGVRKIEIIPQRIPRSLLSDGYLTIDELVKKGVENFEMTYRRRPTHGNYAPASIKILGDHCAYNQGCTLSMALNMVALVVGGLNGSGKIRVATTADLEPQKVIFPIPSIKSLQPGPVKWANYIRGVVTFFKGDVPGFDCLIETSLPMGYQILGNAAIQMAMYNFLEELTGSRTEDEKEKASRCMKAEHEFTNTLCGIDDFLVALTGLENQMLLLDCKKSVYSYLPMFDSSLVFLLVYNFSCCKRSKSITYMRLEECYDVAKALGLTSLRCAKQEDLKDVKNVSEAAVKRARHVITEEKRISAGAEALRNNDAKQFGRLMVESHISLRDDFEISSPPLDQIVNRSMEVDGVLGARMTGSEYGSSVLVLVKMWAVDDAIDYIRETCGGDWKYYLLTPSNGSDVVDVKGYIDSLPEPEKTFEKVFAC